MSDWKYGDAGDRIPVRVGDIWRVGPHVIACGDLELGAGHELLGLLSPIEGEMLRPDLCFTDPPWNATAAKGYRTKAGVPNKELDFSSFLNTLFSLVRYTRRDCFVEYGENNSANLDTLFYDAVKGNGGYVVEEWPITYTSKHIPARLMRVAFSRDNIAEEVEGPPPKMKDERMPAYMFEQVAVRGDIVFDPCMGWIGSTARGAVAAGCRAVGLELNPRRMAMVLDWLQKKVGKQPERVGILQTMKEKVNAENT